MRQHEAVIKVMESNNGYATLNYLYENVLKIERCEWKTKTPFASIRRIVQDDRFFFKIKPGLWALKSYKERLKDIFPDLLPDTKENREKKLEFNHTYYQGLLIELGNILNFKTYAPPQDKNKLYLTKKILDIIKLKKIPKFTYDYIVTKAKSVDVIWFNERELPKKMFEVEHSTNIEHSILKYCELEDFYIDFYIVSYKERLSEFNNIINNNLFKNIKERIKFLSYDNISEWHDKSYELYILKNKMGICL